jgi:hypothetical protein
MAGHRRKSVAKSTAKHEAGKEMFSRGGGEFGLIAWE